MARCSQAAGGRRQTHLFLFFMPKVLSSIFLAAAAAFAFAALSAGGMSRAARGPGARASARCEAVREEAREATGAATDTWRCK